MDFKARMPFKIKGTDTKLTVSLPSTLHVKAQHTDEPSTVSWGKLFNDTKTQQLLVSLMHNLDLMLMEEADILNLLR